MGDSPQLAPAGEEMFCPRRLIRPQGFPCFISGTNKTDQNRVSNIKLELLLNFDTSASITI